MSSSPSLGPPISQDEANNIRNLIAQATQGIRQVASDLKAEGSEAKAGLLGRMATAVGPDASILHRKAMGDTRKTAKAASGLRLANLVEFTGRGGYRRKWKVRPDLFQPGLSMSPGTQIILGSLCQSLNSASYNSVDNIVGSNLLNAANALPEGELKTALNESAHWRPVIRFTSLPIQTAFETAFIKAVTDGYKNVGSKIQLHFAHTEGEVKSEWKWLLDMHRQQRSQRKARDAKTKRSTRDLFAVIFFAGHGSWHGLRADLKGHENSNELKEQREATAAEKEAKVKEDDDAMDGSQAKNQEEATAKSAAEGKAWKDAEDDEDKDDDENMDGRENDNAEEPNEADTSTDAAGKKPKAAKDPIEKLETTARKFLLEYSHLLHQDVIDDLKLKISEMQKTASLIWNESTVIAHLAVMGVLDGRPGFDEFPLDTIGKHGGMFNFYNDCLRANRAPSDMKAPSKILPAVSAACKSAVAHHQMQRLARLKADNLLLDVLARQLETALKNRLSMKKVHGMPVYIKNFIDVALRREIARTLLDPLRPQENREKNDKLYRSFLRPAADGIAADGDHGQDCQPNCGHTHVDEDDDEVDDEDDEDGDDDAKPTPTKKALAKMLVLSPEASAILAFLNDNFYPYVDIDEDDDDMNTDRPKRGSTSYAQGTYTKYNRDDDEDDGDYVDDGGGEDDDDEEEGEKAISEEDKKKMSHLARAIYSTKGKWAALHLLSAILKEEEAWIEEARVSNYWTPKQADAARDAAKEGMSDRLPSEDAEGVGSSSSSSSSPSDGDFDDDDDDQDASEAASPEAVDGDKVLAFLNKHRYACRKLFTLLPLGKMKSIFITLQPGFEVMLSKESREALLIAQAKLKAAWSAIGTENINAGRPRGALAERVALGQPDLLEVAFHLLGARDGGNRALKEIRKNRVMTDGFSMVQYFTSRPGRGDREKTFWNARRDGERVIGGLPPPLKDPVDCDDLEKATADAEDASTAALEKSAAAEVSLKEADEMVHTAEGDLTTCGGCNGWSSCLHNECTCLEESVYCNPACGCKCGKRCRNQCKWLYNPADPDTSCAFTGCANKQKSGLFQCNDGDKASQVFGQPSTSCGRYFHRTCVNVHAPPNLCPACSIRLSNIDAGNELVGMRKDAAEALQGARRAEKTANSAADKAAAAKAKSTKAAATLQHGAATAVPVDPANPLVFLGSFKSAVINMKGLSSVLAEDGHVCIGPPEDNNPLRTVRTLTGINGALLGQVDTVGNNLLSALPNTCIFNNASVGGKKTVNARSLSLYIYVFGREADRGTVHGLISTMLGPAGRYFLSLHANVTEPPADWAHLQHRQGDRVRGDKFVKRNTLPNGTPSGGDFWGDIDPKLTIAAKIPAYEALLLKAERALAVSVDSYYRFKDPPLGAKPNKTESNKAHWEAQEDASRVSILREIIAELKSGRDIRLICIDTGLRNLYKGVEIRPDGSEKIWDLTRADWMNAKGDAHRLRQCNARCKQFQVVFDLFNRNSPKTASFDKFMIYARIAKENRASIINEKLTLFWKRSSFEAYQARQSALDGPLAIIRRGEPHRGTANKRCFIGYSDGGFSQFRRKGSKSVPITSLLAAFKKIFGASSIIMVDEYHTTRCCAGCGQDLTKIHTNRWSDFKVAKYKAQLKAFESGTRPFAPYRLHETHRIEGLLYCENQECKYGRMFVDRDVTAARSMQDGLLSWLRCAPPPTHMRRGGPKLPDRPDPLYLHYNEEVHWYKERRLPVPNQNPFQQEEEEEEEEQGIPQGNMGNNDAPEVPDPTSAPVVVDQSAMAVVPVPTVAPPSMNSSGSFDLLLKVADEMSKSDAQSAMIVDPPVTIAQDNASMRAALAQVAATAALNVAVDVLRQQTAVIATKLDNLTTAVNTVATGIASLSAAHSLTLPPLSAPSSVLGLTPDNMELVEMTTNEVSTKGTTSTTTVTTGPTTTTTVTTTGPTSTTTTTTTTRRKSAVIVPTSVSSSLGAGSEQASDPNGHISSQPISVENAKQPLSSSLMGGLTSGTSPASSLIGETQRLVQSSGEGEEKTESNTQEQNTQRFGESTDPNGLSSSSGTAFGTSPS